MLWNVSVSFAGFAGDDGDSRRCDRRVLADSDGVCADGYRVKCGLVEGETVCEYE